MLRRPIFAGLIGLCFLTIASIFSAAMAAQIASVVAFYGYPTVNGQALSLTTAIQEHDKISVGPGNVQLVFTDGTKLVVGENSTLVIEKYLMTSGNTAQNFAIDALRGTFRFITGRSAKAAYDIKTSNATIGIRGTGFDFWVKNKTGVVVVDGLVRLCSHNICVDIPANCHAGIADNAGGHLLRGLDMSNNIRVNLPYLQDQAFLRQQFHLNIQTCAENLSLTAPAEHSSGPPPLKCNSDGCR